MATKTKEKIIEEVSLNSDPANSNGDNKKLNSEKCFVITPIGGENEPIRRHIDGVYDAAIVPVLAHFGYTPEIPHRMSMPGSINKQIIQKIYDSDLIIANLTNINPNVMYELALRHCFNKPALIIAEEGTDLPFDINNERTIFYINDAQGILDLKKKLLKAIGEIRAKEEYNSPVVSVLGELKFEEQIMKKNVDSKENDYFNSLQMILRRLDRIESGTRNNIAEERIMEPFIRTYRIISSNDSIEEFDDYITQFFDVCRKRGVRFKHRKIDDKRYEIDFYHLSQSTIDFIDSEINSFCAAFDLKYIRA